MINQPGLRGRSRFFSLRSIRSVSKRSSQGSVGNQPVGNHLTETHELQTGIINTEKVVPIRTVTDTNHLP